MIRLERVVLDVLKPHHPDVLELGRALAGSGEGLHVHITVVEMDDKTETLEVVIEGTDVDMERVRAAIADLGASLHSVDQVAMRSTPDPDTGSSTSGP